MAIHVAGWWFDPIASAVKDANGKTVGRVVDPADGPKLAAGVELVLALSLVERVANDGRIDPAARLVMVRETVTQVLTQLQRDQIAALPEANPKPRA